MEESNIDPRETRFISQMIEVKHKMEYLVDTGVVESAGDRIKVIESLDALTNKLQRIKSELEAYESSPDDGAGLVAGNDPGNESVKTRAA